MTCRIPLALALLTALAACDPQADSDYQGEALATMQGQVVAETDISGLEDWRAMLVWNNSAGSPDTVTAEDAAVEGSFPSTFNLSVFAPPADEALNDYTQGGTYPDDSRIGVGYIVALPGDLTVDDIESDPPYTGPIGISEGHMVVYVESDVQPGTSAEQVVGLLDAGFHVMDVVDVDDPACDKDPFDCLVEAAGGMDTQIEVKIDEIDNLDPPNWT